MEHLWANIISVIFVSFNTSYNKYKIFKVLFYNFQKDLHKIHGYY